MKNISHYLSELRKFLWGVCFVSIILSILYIPWNEGATRIIMSFFSPWYEGKILDQSFRDDIEKGDAAAALAVLKKYEPWEKKAVVYKKKKMRDSKHYKPFVLGYTYPSRYVLTYDLLGRYDDALEWLRKRQEIPKTVGENVGLTNCPGDYEEYLFAAEARIHYKMGEKRKAFLDYTNIFKEYVEGVRISSSSFYREGFQYLLTMDHDCGKKECRRYYHGSSCFSYPEFLEFMEEEFAEMGSPEDYQAAMEYFRALGDEGLFKTFCEAVQKDEDWNQEKSVPFSTFQSVCFHVEDSRKESSNN